MKLWVDDIRNAPDDSWTVARTVNGAICFIALFGQRITEISLDHDISHQVTVGALGRPYPCEETFVAVAYYIAAYYAFGEQPTVEKVKITIHTSNVAGGERMRSILAEYGFEIEVKHMGLANRLEMEV